MIKFLRNLFGTNRSSERSSTPGEETESTPANTRNESDEFPVEIIGVHEVLAREPCHLIELVVHNVQSELEMSEFTQRNPMTPRSSWQVPYDDKFLDSTGTKVLGDVMLDAFRRPELWSGEVRLAFFFHYLEPDKPFDTPFGPVGLPKPSPLPDRLNIMKYPPVD